VVPSRCVRAAAGALAVLAAWTVAPLAEAAAPPSLVLVGDTQRTSLGERLLLREQNDGPRAQVVAEIAREAPGLVVILGDLVESGGSRRAWAFFDSLTAPLGEAAIPTVAVLGNHDYRGVPGAGPAAVASRFPALASRTWGVVRSGAIAVVLLDSNFEQFGTGETRRQIAWFESELDALDRDPSVSAVVVCCHHPPYTNSRVVSPSAAVAELFVPPFSRARKAVLFASGHCHSYEHFRRDGRDFVVTGGGGGPRQKVEVGPLRREFVDLFAGPAVRPFHFCKVDLAGGRLVVEMVALGADGGGWEVRDRFTTSPPPRGAESTVP
jgi:3',5'-cyclic AMP phosphodiesterase CpdA